MLVGLAGLAIEATQNLCLKSGVLRSAKNSPQIRRIFDRGQNNGVRMWLCCRWVVCVTYTVQLHSFVIIFLPETSKGTLP